MLAWVLIQPRTPDLAAQVYRVNLFHQLGFSVWDERWYGGHHLPGYSLTFPPLAELLGIRTLGALAALASTGLFERIARLVYGSAARWGATLFALAAVGDLWIGRVTFAVGVSLALAAVLALMRGRAATAAILGVLCAAGSPVAGALLALAAVSLTLARGLPRIGTPRGGSARSGGVGSTASLTPGGSVAVGRGQTLGGPLALGAPAALVVIALALLFPEGGFEPFPTLSFAVTAAIVLGFLRVLPRERALERVGALVYLAACLGSLALHTPMGSNIERYGVLLAGPLLLCCLLCDRPGAGAPSVSIAAGSVLLAITTWMLWGPVRETAAVAHNLSTRAAYYLPVERFLATHGGSAVRVEVPFTRGHWEAAWLAPTVSLARGWEKQLDERYDGVLLEPGLTASAYLRWLRREAVGYVALPDTPLDPSSAQEGRLIRSGPGYLREVFHDPHWRIYRVLDATPLLQGPGTLTAMGHDSFALTARSPGSLVLRVRYTRYLTVIRGRACVSEAPGGWTAIEVIDPGSLTVAARFSLGRGLGLDGESCAHRRATVAAPAADSHSPIVGAPANGAPSGRSPDLN